MFFYKCSNSGINNSTSQTPNNVSWISSKAKLEISLLKSRWWKKLRKSGPTIDPATSVHDRKSQKWGFFVKTQQVLIQHSKKFVLKIFNSGIPNRSMLVVEKTKSNMQEEAIERMKPSPGPEACCMIEGWDPKRIWKSACMQAAHQAHFFVPCRSSEYTIQARSSRWNLRDLRRNVRVVMQYLCSLALTHLHAQVPMSL